MLLAAIIAVCVLLLVLGFVAPRLSHGPERGVGKALGTGARGASKAPGKLGTLLAKPFHSSNRAKSKSAHAGRKGRAKLPL